MYSRISINVRVKWFVVPNFLRNDRPPWTLNILDPYADCGYRGSITSPDLGSGSGRHSDGVSINWNLPARVLPVYHQRIFENNHSAACHACDDILMETARTA